MVLPIDAIVPIYFSGAVNPASANNQSFAPGGSTIMQNLLIHTEQERLVRNFDKRTLQKLDIVFGIPSGLSEQLVLSETIIVRKVIPKVSGETLSLAELILRKVIPHIAETLTLSESIKRKLSRFVSDTLTLSESVLRKPIPKISVETLHLAESVLRKVKPKITETITLTESSIIRKLTRKVAETLTLSESPLRKPIPHIAEVLTLVEALARKVLRHTVTIFPHWRN